MPAVYLDASALLKRVLPEAESEALDSFLDRLTESGTPMASSALAWLEVERTVRAYAAARPQEPLGNADAVRRSAMSGVHRIPLTNAVLNVAGWVGTHKLKGLDSIHLASAVLVGATVMVTYDQTLAEAARTVNLQVEGPS